MAPSTSPGMFAKLAAEFLGTFLLVFTVGCNVLSFNAAWGGVSIAMVLMVMVYSLGGISGGHFNPAVSIALGLNKAIGGPGLSPKDVLMYCGVQVVAGILAAFAYSRLFWDNFDLTPARDFGLLNAGACELLYTFMLVFVVLNVAVAQHPTPNQYYGVAIGFVIVAGAYGAGAVSSGCFNPAVAIGIDVASKGLSFGWCKAYLLFEVAGGVLAVIWFRMTRPEDFGGVHKDFRAQIASEFIGTYMLVLTVGLNVLGKSPCGAFSIAASLMCMVYAIGDVSGGHFNPAVTFAIVASRRCPELSVVNAIAYVVAQLAGGIAAAFTYSLIYAGGSFKLGPAEGFGYTEVFVTECMFTFILCYVVLAVAVSKTTNNTLMFGFAIGSCITVGGNAIGKISGGYLNPAVNFGVAAAHQNRDKSFIAAMLYTLFQLLGAAVAVGAFAVTHRVDFKKDKLALPSESEFANSEDDEDDASDDDEE